MNATPLKSSFASKFHHSRRDHRKKEHGMSPRTLSGKHSAASDVRTYRQHFASVWQHFIIANFESPAHVAHVFKVDPTTAEKWWAGSHAPQGWVVGRAMSDPAIRDAAIKMFSEVA